ncbi:DoxX family protein [Candidatus Omnitrophota bacterium]
MRNWAALPLRLGLGIMFMAHGLQKAFGLFGGSGIEKFAGMLSGMGFAPAAFWAYLVAYIELIGGLFLIIGLCTRISAALLLSVMAVAAIKVHLPNGFFMGSGGVEYIFVISAACVSLLVSGGGKLSITKKL